jgi:amidase
MSELAYESAGELARRIRDREISCLELLDHFIGRVEQLDGRTNAIPVRDFERARVRAREADAALAKGEAWGPLHGVPMTVKESYDVAGLRTTWGFPLWKDNVATTDAVVVERLKRAGATIFGKSNVPLLLGDFQSYNEIYGVTGNPWDATRTPGGSSGGGAAALAAGMVALEAGSDIGGSVRNPPHFCGVYGHKSTYGVVPGRGHAPPGITSASDISVVGPMARSAEDLLLEFEVIAGPDVLQAGGWKLDLPKPRQKSLKDFRVAVWLDEPRFPVDGEVRERLEAAIEAVKRAGASVVDARPEFDASGAYSTYLSLLNAVINARRPKEDYERALTEVAKLAPDDQSYLAHGLRGTTMAHRDWLAWNEARTKLRWAWHRFFERFDVMLCPIAPAVAFKHDHSPGQYERTIGINGKDAPYLDQLFWAGITCVAYLPATVAPVGPGRSGLPIGLQIVGPESGDLVTIEFARLLAREIGGFKRPPGY